MKYSTATIQAAHVDGGPVHTVDLEGMDAVGLFDKLRELFPTEDADELDADEDHPEECPARVLLTNPEGFAVHLFDKSKNGDTLWNPSDSFDELLEAWSDESDDDRREAMGEYLDDMGADDLSGFDEVYRGNMQTGPRSLRNWRNKLVPFPMKIRGSASTGMQRGSETFDTITTSQTAGLFSAICDLHRVRPPVALREW